MIESTELIYPDWPAPQAVRAAFTSRRGGVSRPPFDSLNVGAYSGDEPRAVAENRRRVREALSLPADPAWLRQEHGAAVVTLERVAAVPGQQGPPRKEPPREDPAWDEPLRADAAISGQSGRVCAIQVADCMPVLLAARDGAAVGAAHAGWRGLAAGVLEAAVAALGTEPCRVAADRLIAWLGPAIGPEHFEVREEVRAAFIEPDAGADGAFTRNARGRWQCDLYALARRRLAAAGVREVYGGGWCTYGDPGRFFSYRRDGQCGRMAALIWIER
ncbi:MAG: peptidoglycan editing factor PgeF [Steroidobacteraceae bacterium]